MQYVIENKQVDDISNTISKRPGAFTENFTNFFSNAGKTENVPILEDHLSAITFISKQLRPLSLYNFICITKFIQ